jgi:hypothetical protein
MNAVSGQEVVPLNDVDFSQANAFALWRLRTDTLYFRPDAWRSVERLKAACLLEARQICELRGRGSP